MNNYIGVIDYGIGNIGSILNMLKKLRVAAISTAEPDELFGAKGLILPGVGAFDNGMQNLAKRDLVAVLNEAALIRHIPVLGICLGMQLLTKGSEEGRMEGLGWIDGYTRRFRFEGNQLGLRIPHMGWNEVTPSIPQSGDESVASKLFPANLAEQRYYFVHSYHVCCAAPDNVLATARYGYDFAAAIGKSNIVGAQFHPEKSHRFGMDLFRRFTEAALNAPASNE